MFRLLGELKSDNTLFICLCVSLGLKDNEENPTAAAEWVKLKVNKRDNQGLGLLHILTKRCRVFNTHKFNCLNAEELESFNTDLLTCMKTLLSHGLDPNATVAGFTAMDFLFLHSKNYSDKFKMTNSLIPMSLNILEKSLKLFLQYGADTTKCFSNPLILALDAAKLLNYSTVSVSFRDILHPLLEHGCDPNTTDSYGKTVLLRMFDIMWRRNPTNINPCQQFNDAFLQLVTKGVDLMVVITYRNPHESNRKELKQTTYMDEISDRLCPSQYLNQEPMYYKELILLTLIFFRHGCDMHKLETICGITKKNFDEETKGFPAHLVTNIVAGVYEQEVRAKSCQIKDLYFRLLLHIAKFIYPQDRDAYFDVVDEKFHKQTSANPTLVDSWNKVRGMDKEPVSLNEQCRLKIASSLNWKVDQKESLIPLPKQLIQYLSFDPDWNSLFPELRDDS